MHPSIYPASHVPIPQIHTIHSPVQCPYIRIDPSDHQTLHLWQMMMVLCPKAGSWVFMPPGDEMSEVVSHCLPHRQLWVSNLSKVAMQWLEVDFNL